MLGIVIVSIQLLHLTQIFLAKTHSKIRYCTDSASTSHKVQFWLKTCTPLLIKLSHVGTLFNNTLHGWCKDEDKTLISHNWQYKFMFSPALESKILLYPNFTLYTWVSLSLQLIYLHSLLQLNTPLYFQETPLLGTSPVRTSLFIWSNSIPISLSSK